MSYSSIFSLGIIHPAGLFLWNMRHLFLSRKYSSMEEEKNIIRNEHSVKLIMQRSISLILVELAHGAVQPEAIRLYQL